MSEPAAQWRDGVFIPAARLYCDAERPRDVCFVSRLSAPRPRGRHPLITAPETLAALAGSKNAAELSLAVPCGRPFTLGARRLELYRSGVGAGAASVVIDAGGVRIAYAGRVNPHGGGLGGKADVRACDALIIEALYADPDSVLLPADETRSRAHEFARACHGEHRVPVFLVAAPETGIDLADAVAPMRVAAHHAIAHPARQLRIAGLPVPPIRRVEATPDAATVIVWPLSRRGQLDHKIPPDARRTMLVSGEASDPEALARAGADTGLAWETAADFPTLAAYVDATSASRIYVTGRAADAAAALLSRPDRPATRLGPPTQMALSV